MLCFFFAAPSRAEPPTVATDIVPVQGLVDRVMAGVGEAGLILPPGASPHGYAMRPSEARRLARADLVIWIGPGLTPWLERSLASLSPDSARLVLSDVPGTRLLAARTLEDFGSAATDGDGHGHEGAHEHEDDHDHDHELAHDHGDHEAHEDHDHEAHEDHAAHEGHDDHEHDHDGDDPHTWLDPGNAAIWLDAIAGALGQLDPDNAETYRANAHAGQAELEDLTETVRERLAGARDKPFAVFHDSTRYFEERFGLTAIGAVSLSDARAPGPAHISALRVKLLEHDVQCLFTEPQLAPGLVETLSEGLPLKAAVLDPLGSTLEAGPDLYLRLLSDLSDQIAACLMPEG